MTPASEVRNVVHSRTTGGAYRVLGWVVVVLSAVSVVLPRRGRLGSGATGRARSLGRLAEEQGVDGVLPGAAVTGPGGELVGAALTPAAPGPGAAPGDGVVTQSAQHSRPVRS